MALTLAYDPQLSRVRISATGLGDMAPVTVERSADQVRWSTVRGGAAITPSGGLVNLDDYEFAAGVANYYRVVGPSAWDGFTRGPLILNANPYFETTATPWTAVAGGTVARSTAQAHEGSASLLFTPDGVTATCEVRSENAPGVVAGQTYRASSWVRCAVARSVNINIVWRDAAGTFLSSAGAVSVLLAANTWTPIEVFGTAPASAAQAQISVSMGSTPPASNLLWIDEATLWLAGWGTSDSGLPWTTSGGAASDYSVTGSAGRHSLPAVSSSRRTLLAVQSETVPVFAPIYTDVDAAVSIKVAVLAAGAAINPGLMVRYLDGNNYYFAELALNTDQTVRVQLRKNVAGVLTTFAQPFVEGVVHSTTGVIRLRLQATGQTLRCKAWLAGTDEPDWQATAVDSAFTIGAVGCRSSLTSGNTNTLPVAVDFDDFVVLSPTRVDTPVALTAAVSDTFTRTVSGGWGTSSSGHAWENAGGVAADFAVNGTAGTHSMTAINLTWRTLLPATLQPRDADITWTVSTPAAVGGAIESSAMFRIDPANIDGTYLYAETELKPTGQVQVRLLSRSGGSDTPLAGPNFVPGLTHGAGVKFKIRAQVWGRIFRMKVWLASGSEPAGWSLTGDTDVVRAGRVGLRSTSDPTNTNTLPIVVTYDDVTVSALDGSPLTPVLAGVWLKSIARPFLNRQVVVVDYSDVERPARAGVFDVIGRSHPVAVSDVRGSRRWTLVVLTETLDEAADFDLVLASGDPMFIHVPADVDVPGGYVTIGDTTQRRTSRRSARRVFELPCVEVAAPGPDVVGATVNWQTVLSAYATWQDVLDAHATWEDLLELVGSPTDVVVP